MKFSIAILTLISIFAWNAFADSFVIESLSQDTKILIPELKSLEFPVEQPSPSTQFVQCRFQSDRSPASLNNSSWNIIANGANLEQRTITLFNSQSNEVMMMNCYKYLPESPRKTIPVSNSQVMDLLKASRFKVL